MFNDPLVLIAVAACLLVLGILALGIGSFGKGGEFNRLHANRLMRYRIAAQAFAVVVIVGIAYWRSRG